MAQTKQLNRQARAFTLTEMLVAVTILAVVIYVGQPDPD